MVVSRRGQATTKLATEWELFRLAEVQTSTSLKVEASYAIVALKVVQDLDSLAVTIFFDHQSKSTVFGFNHLGREVFRPRKEAGEASTFHTLRSRQHDRRVLLAMPLQLLPCLTYSNI